MIKCTNTTKKFLAVLTSLTLGNLAFGQTCLPVFQYNADGNMITKVEFGSINNTSPFTSGTTPNYEDFKTLSTNVTAGNTYVISVKGPSSTFPSDVVAQIDWNQNGTYEANELTYLGRLADANPANALTITADIVVPANAVAGTAVMRLIKNTNVAAYSNPTSPNSITGACGENLRSGQVEEYSLTVTGSTSVPTCNNETPGLTPGDLGCITVTENGVPKVYTTVRAADGNIWLQQNLGSSQVGTVLTDVAAYGDLYQWGRTNDGHEKRTSVLSTTPLTNNNPLGLNTSDFISTDPRWFEPGTINDTWQAKNASQVTANNGINPCANLGDDWIIPTEQDWITVKTAENITSVSAGFSSNLKIVAAGNRSTSGSFDFVGVRAFFWSSTISASNPDYVKTNYISGAISNPSAGYYKQTGNSVRCIFAPAAPIQSSIEIKTLNNVPASITTYQGTLQLNAEITPSTMDQAVTWQLLNNPSTASISSTGLVSAIENGIVKAVAISVADANLKDTLEITITQQVAPIQSSIEIKTLNNVPASITTYQGTLQLTAEITPSTMDQAVTWQLLNNPSAATISSTGLVSAIENGIVKAVAISVADANLKDTLEITITQQVAPVIQVTAVQVATLNNVVAEINGLQETLALVATVLPANAPQAVTWSIVNGTGNAQINTSGVVTSLNIGNVWAIAKSVQNPSIKDSIQVTIKTVSGLGIDEISAEKTVRVYPNPTNELIYIQTETSENFSVVIYDLQGKMIQQQVMSPQQQGTPLSIANLTTGNYILKVVSNTLVYQTIVTKQ